MARFFRSSKMPDLRSRLSCTGGSSIASAVENYRPSQARILATARRHESLPGMHTDYSLSKRRPSATHSHTYFGQIRISHRTTTGRSYLRTHVPLVRVCCLSFLVYFITRERGFRISAVKGPRVQSSELILGTGPG